MDPAPAPQDAGPDPRRWRALAVCLVAGFMTLLDVSIVNVALPSIEAGIGATASDLQWIVSGYALTFGLVLVGAGRTGDAIGRRTMFIVGVLVFGVSSLAAGLAPNSGVLVAARLLQGIGGGLLNPQVSGLIQELFSGRERGRAFGLLGATIGVSTAVGPLAGGLIIGLLGVEAGWRWIFFVNLPIVAGAVILALRWLPAPHRRHPERRPDLDPVGVVILGLGVGALLLPLIESGRGDGLPVPWWTGLIGAGLIAAFVAWESSYVARGRSPLVDVALFRIPGYPSGAIVSAVYFAGFTGIFFVLTIYFQQGLGYSALAAGLMVTPYAAGSAVGSALGGRLVHRWGRLLVTGGITLSLIGLVAVDVVLTTVDGPGLGWALAVPLLVGGIGSGFVISPNITLTLHDVPVHRAGTAAGVLQTGQRLGTAAGIALIGSIFFALGTASGDRTSAAAMALRVAAAVMSLALVASAVDLRARRREGRLAPAATAPASPPSGIRPGDNPSAKDV
ncbi:MFS transporter [Intrasporangium sp.]|uniref:MFS transporter n=1 Tax=Intrasporangium sp. TaxID=1925024 RepID=UPI00293B78EF|nr:MFS transporter [Intrasporangium sp.]MDV3220368.1 MFS transporter [Intrasporangium sp.]